MPGEATDTLDWDRVELERRTDPVLDELCEDRDSLRVDLRRVSDSADDGIAADIRASLAALEAEIAARVGTASHKRRR